MGQTGAGEHGQFLAPDQGVQAVNGGDTGLNELVGIVPGRRVGGQAVDVHLLFGQNRRAAVDGIAHAVKYAAKHILGYGKLGAVTQKADLGTGQVDAGGAFKQLDHGVGAIDLQHLAAADRAVGQLDFAQFVIGDVFYVADQHQRAGDFLYRAVFLNHQRSPPSAINVSICSFISCMISAYTFS